MTTDIEAIRAWEFLSEEHRGMILSNVYCGHGCGVVTIVDYDISLPDEEGLLLKGLCGKCGSPVARYVEEVFPPG